MKFAPRPYQHLAIRHLLDVPRSGLFARMGMGKSASTLAALDALYLTGEDRPTLIIAPLRVARDTWPKEVRKWDDFRHFEMATIVGTEKERLAALQRDVPLYTTNFEQLPWLIEHYGARWPFGTVVCDEASKLKRARLSFRTHPKTGKLYLQTESGSSKRAGMLAKVVLSRSARFYALTGTPAANGLTDLWALLFFMDKGARLGRSYGAFEARWFERVMRHPRDQYGELRPKAGAEAEINARIADICLALSPEDWFPDLQAPLQITVRVSLPPKARALYNKMEREMFIEIGRNGIEAFNAGSMMMKCRQLAAGAILEQDEQGKSTKRFVEIHDEKLQALADIYDDAGGAPLLVAYQFQSDLARLLKAFPKGVDLSTTEGVAKFMKGEATMGFGHPQSIGHGYDGLQDVTNIMVFYSGDWNLEYREQMIERIGPVRQLQSGHNRKVLVYDIVAEDTIDEMIAARVQQKCTVQEAVFAAMKRKGLA